MIGDTQMMGRICDLSYIKGKDGSPDTQTILKVLQDFYPEFGSVDGFNNRSSQAIICRHPKFNVLCFRGTDEAADWLDNGNFFTVNRLFGTFHAGFYGAVSDIYQQIYDSLTPFRLPLIVTGHSLGGAMASIFLSLALSNSVRIQACYTFGQPRAMTVKTAKIFDSFYEKKYYRYVNNNDFVTHFPPFFLGFRHVGSEYYISSKMETIKKPNIFKKLIDCAADLYRAATKKRIDGLDDHNVIQYLKAFDPGPNDPESEW